MGESVLGHEAPGGSGVYRHMTQAKGETVRPEMRAWGRALLLTGLGALGGDQFAKDSDAASALAVAAVIASSVAVACAPPRCSL